MKSLRMKKTSMNVSTKLASSLTERDLTQPMSMQEHSDIHTIFFIL